MVDVENGQALNISCAGEGKFDEMSIVTLLLLGDQLVVIMERERHPFF